MPCTYKLLDNAFQTDPLKIGTLHYTGSSEPRLFELNLIRPVFHYLYRIKNFGNPLPKGNGNNNYYCLKGSGQYCIQIFSDLKGIGCDRDIE